MSNSRRRRRSWSKIRESIETTKTVKLKVPIMTVSPKQTANNHSDAVVWDVTQERSGEMDVDDDDNDDGIEKKKTPPPRPPSFTKYFSYQDEELTSTTKDHKQPKDYSKLDIFHRAAWPIFLIAQCFAVMPVTGVCHPNPQRVRFSLKSLQILAFVIFLVASVILTTSTFRHLLNIGINAKNFVGLVFFSVVQFAAFLFLSLATRWPRIIRYWTRVEIIFTRPPYVPLKKNLTYRLRSAAAAIIFLSLLEHGLYLASATISYKRRIEICAPLQNSSEVASFTDFLEKNYANAFEVIPFSIYAGIYILIVNFACTFLWNYMDLFIMIISKAIAYRFEQITDRFNKLADQEVPEVIFKEIREHYVKLCELLEFIDENLSGIILLSCMNNLYFVCYQLLNIFNKLRWPINYIYFWYSLLYLIGRTTFVFLCAAAINDESKAALGVLRRFSTKTWCVEVDRLIFQMTTQTVALTGKKFYFLTRRLLFGMAGTIVTYELVLLQFDEPNRSAGLPDLCA